MDGGSPTAGPPVAEQVAREVTMTSRPAGTLVSVNVGLPRDVTWRGRTVRTGVWKYPVAGPRRVRRLNLDGDGQGDLAGHGGEQRAALVYQTDSYRYWAGELGRSDLAPGHFGENLTVDGLPDDEVCIGDRYRIGSAVFEVTQPRVTCYRVGLRLGEPRMPALLVARRRPGFYLRVLEEGEVSAGDEITLVAAGPERMSVAEVDGLLYLPGHGRDDVARALRIPALSPGWRASFAAILDDGSTPGGGNAGLVDTAPPPAWPGFRPFRVTARQAESRTVTSLVLAPADASPAPPALPGQFVTLRLPSAPPGPALLRSYSLSGTPGDPRYRIGVKREPGGAGSGYVHDRVRIGDMVDVAAPRGNFTLRPGPAPVLLVSAGVGATPVLAMLHALAGTHSDREVWWLHGARNRAEQPFAAEADALLAGLPNAHRHVAYSRPDPGDRPGRDFDSVGRLSAPALTALDLPRDADAYLCGPAGFLRDVSAALVALGLDPAHVHTEIFGARPAITPGIAASTARPPHPPPTDPGHGPSVAFSRSGLTVSWHPDYASLLELAEACDVPTRWSCRSGVCHTCETPLLSGAVAYSPDPVEQPAVGDVLICSATPTGPVALDL